MKRGVRSAAAAAAFAAIFRSLQQRAQGYYYDDDNAVVVLACDQIVHCAWWRVSFGKKKCATLGFFDDLPTTILNGMDNNGIAK